MASAVLERDKELLPPEFISDPEKIGEEALFESVRKYLEEVSPLNLYSPLVKIRSLPISYSVANLERLVSLIFEQAVSVPTGGLDRVRAFGELCTHFAWASGITAVVVENDSEYTLAFKQVLITLVIKELEKLSTKLTYETEPEEESKSHTDCEGKLHHSELRQRDEKQKEEFLQRLNGSVRFLHELFKSKIITLGILIKCIQPLLNSPKEEFLRPLIGLVFTIMWKNSQNDEKEKPVVHKRILQNEELFKDFLKRLSEMAQQESKVASRGVAMLQDLINPPQKKTSNESLPTEESQPDVLPFKQDLEPEDTSESALAPEKTEGNKTKEIMHGVTLPFTEKKKRKLPKIILDTPENKKREWKLNTVEYPWKPARLMKNDSRSKEDKETEELLKKVRGILNRLTCVNFDTLAQKFNTLPINSESQLSQVANIIFDKAVREPLHTKVYVNLCKRFSNLEIPGVIPKLNMRKVIITICQNQFEDSVSRKSIVPELIEKIQSCTDLVEKEKLELNMIEAEMVKRSSLKGTVRFIGELFDSNMITTSIIVKVVDTLFDHVRDETVEALCVLLIFLGKHLQLEEKTYNVNRQLNSTRIFERMLDLLPLEKDISIRARCLVKNFIELQQHVWVPRVIEEFEKRDNRP